jgi:hypothetical protein
LWWWDSGHDYFRHIVSLALEAHDLCLVVVNPSLLLSDVDIVAEMTRLGHLSQLVGDFDQLTYLFLLNILV